MSWFSIHQVMEAVSSVHWHTYFEQLVTKLDQVCFQNQIVEYWTNEEVQPYEMFVGFPWSEYLNEMLLDET